VGSSGIGGFPFQSYNETFIETGIAAPFSLADFGDSLIWIGQDARGQRACWRDQAFQPQRVSNFAVEQRWAGFDRIDDAVAFPLIWKGHMMYQVSFPSAHLDNKAGNFGETWVYDATISALVGRPIWHERQFLTPYGVMDRRPELFHCFAWGKHLVGSTGTDGNPGAIYQYNEAPDWDCATSFTTGLQMQQPVVRDRICPHLWQNNKRVIYDRLELEGTRGVGLDGAPPVGANPQWKIRWSNDAGNTYGPEFQVPMGPIGQYRTLARINRTGYSRDRVFWVRSDEPVQAGLVNAMLDLRPCAS
jgi:hypothetical protein